MDVRVILEEAFLVCNEEVGSVGDGAQRTIDGARSVCVRVEVDYSDGAVDFVERAEDGEDDGVVTSETSRDGQSA